MSIIKHVRTVLFLSISMLFALLTIAAPASASSLTTNWLMAGIWEGRDGSLAHHAPQQSRSNTATTNGRYAVFWSEAGNLVANDTNQVSDIFIFDYSNKTTARINLGAGGTQANGHTRNVTISGDGRYIGFVTAATNTAVGPQCIPGHDCTFAGVLNRITGAVTVASKNANGQLMPVTNGQRPITTMHPAIISGDGNSFLFSTHFAKENSTDIFVRNLTTGTVAQANVDAQGMRSQWGGYDPSISNDGRYVAFTALMHLVPHDQNGMRDVYVRDIQERTLRIASHAYNDWRAASGTSESGNISGDGRYVVFRSFSTNLLEGGNVGIGNIFLSDLQDKTVKQITTARWGGMFIGQSYEPSITADGSHIVFTSDANNLVRADVQRTRTPDLFIHYTRAGITRMVKLPLRTDVDMFVRGNPVINADGKVITYPLYTRSATNQAANSYNLYYNHDPVSHIPFYDPGDILDILP